MMTKTPDGEAYPYPADRLWESSVGARKQRGRWLLAISQGMLGPSELFEAALDPEAGRALRLIPLAALFGSLPGWNHRRVERAMKVLRHSSGVSERVPDSGLDVMWVLDERSPGARRLVAVAEALVVAPPGHRRGEQEKQRRKAGRRR